MSQNGFYAVVRGRSTGIFRSWEETQAQVSGFPRNKHKKFSTYAQAEEYLRGCGVEMQAAPPFIPEMRFFAVVVGRRPGIYTDRGAAEREMEGIWCSGVTPFANYLEAETHLAKFNLGIYRIEDDNAGHRAWLAIFLDVPELSGATLAFCDGSLPRNGTNTNGTVACVFPHRPDLNVDVADISTTTNTRAEYVAAAWALGQANAADPSRQTTLFIFTGSENLVKTMTEYVHVWMRNGWRKTRGAPVENQELIQHLVLLSGGRRVEWRHVHSETDKEIWKWRWSKLAEDKARARSGTAVAA